MESIICILLIVFAIIILTFVFKIDLKKIKCFKENEEIENITNKFPENIDIAKEMLDMLDNKEVKIEEAKDTGTSLYIAITNKIIIADMKNNYARIQTIAHECLHACQDRFMLLFNFIFSNISIIYFFITSLFTIFKVINNEVLQIAILMIFFLIQFSVRSFLEIDAMTRAKFLAKEYIEKKKLCTEEEKNKIINEYERINKVGIPFTVFNLLVNGFIRIFIYCIITIIV